MTYKLDPKVRKLLAKYRPDGYLFKMLANWNPEWIGLSIDQMLPLDKDGKPVERIAYGNKDFERCI